MLLLDEKVYLLILFSSDDSAFLGAGAGGWFLMHINCKMNVMMLSRCVCMVYLCFRC